MNVAVTDSYNGYDRTFTIPTYAIPSGEVPLLAILLTLLSRECGLFPILMSTSITSFYF